MVCVIAETAWHHEGDFSFMQSLVNAICFDSTADIVKLHITLDLDEYMHKTHKQYELLKSWVFSEKEWEKLISLIQGSGKKLMLLLNDTKAIQFASQFKPSLVELHSVCLNVPRLQQTILDYLDKQTKIVIGIGGCLLQEIDAALQVFNDRNVVLMFGFQNYPTKLDAINLKKIRKIQSLYSTNQFGYADHTVWNEPNNELITLLVAANRMDYIEKHVTTLYGQERCDHSAAVSIEMLNSLSKKLKILNQVYGDGSIVLNNGEKTYSNYGPMKMAAIMRKNLPVGHVLSSDDFTFCRFHQSTRMSQIDVLESVGQTLKKPVAANQVMDWEVFEDN